MPEAVNVPDPRHRVHPRGGAGLGGQADAADRRAPVPSRQRCWHIDETYLKVAGAWCYLYRAIDGNLVDVYLSETRDMAAAKAFLRSAKSVPKVEPEQVTTDGHTSYPRVIADELVLRVNQNHARCDNQALLPAVSVV